MINKFSKLISLITCCLLLTLFASNEATAQNEQSKKKHHITLVKKKPGVKQKAVNKDAIHFSAPQALKAVKPSPKRKEMNKSLRLGQPQEQKEEVPMRIIRRADKKVKQ